MNIKNTDESKNNKIPTKVTLSRPQRKAIERERKEQQDNKKLGSKASKVSKMKKNNAKNNNRSSNRYSGSSINEILEFSKLLNNSSNDVASTMNSTSTSKASAGNVELVLSAIKRSQNSNNVQDLYLIHKLLQCIVVEQANTSNYSNNFMYTDSERCSVLARFAVAALHMKQYSIASNSLQLRKNIIAKYNHKNDTDIEAIHDSNKDLHLLIRPKESSAIVRGLLRMQNITQAVEVLNLELSIPESCIVTNAESGTTVATELRDEDEQEQQDEEVDDGTKEDDYFHNVADKVMLTEDDFNDDEDPSEFVDEVKPGSDDYTREILFHRSLCLLSIACRYFIVDEQNLAIQTCEQISKLGPILRSYLSSSSSTTKNSSLQQQQEFVFTMPWIRLLYSAAQCQSRLFRTNRDGNNNNLSNTILSTTSRTGTTFPCNMVYPVLKSMTTYPSDNDDRIYELVANALVRRVVFVTGAVNMDGLPKNDRGEAAFIGRSNVGKSSLINMIANRKSLAFTSKRPGKTQQINFFAVNDKFDREKEIRYGDNVSGTKDPDSFYIVDLPGYGYAAVPPAQRQQWLEFMHRYLSERTTLKVVFHLIDSRIGPTADDAIVMKQVGTYLPTSTAYVIVLTKCDKNVKGSIHQRRGKVAPSIARTLRKVMQDNGIGNAPILLTSAETKLGRDDVWRYLQFAAEA